MITVAELKDKVLDGYQVTYEEGLELLKVSDKEELFAAADHIRRHFCGTRIDLCSITNAKSGKCSEDCKWCSQSAHYHTGVKEYELVDPEAAVDQAVVNASKGVHRYSLVTSGRQITNRTLDRLIPIYQSIRQQSIIGLCASMGLLNRQQLKRLRDEAGIEHYHCNLETAPSFYSKLVTTHSQQEKIETISMARELGLKICSGGIIGMGESAEQRVELAAKLAELKVDSIPVNLLSPVKGTPLEQINPLSKEMVLTTFAIFRFLNPRATIRFAGGRLQIRSFQAEALHAGINAALTGDYLTTTGANVSEDICDFKQAGFTI